MAKSDEVVLETELPGLVRLHRGKVRDVYAVDDAHLLFVATDRISAFDRVLSCGVPSKGAVLNLISAWWFRALARVIDHHMVTERAAEMPAPLAAVARSLGGRAMLVRRAQVVPVECVVRAHLAGSVEAAYRRDGAIQGEPLPPGLPLGGALPRPIFTPTTKAAQGHDEPLTWRELVAKVGPDLARRLRDASLDVFDAAARRCRERGLILCDTKLELGALPGAPDRLVLCDEALTPDSSRFFKADEHVPGRPPVAWDKQVVRDHLRALPAGAMDAPQAPGLPPDVIAATTARYAEVYRVLTGRAIADAVAEAVA